jgi:phosphate starvation-inducible protein PhoH
VPSAPLTGPLVVDEATNDALRLFNARLDAQAENEKAERRVQKAAKAKDDAAGRVRNLENDTKATAEQRAEAAAAYRAAIDAWERARNGEADPASSAAPADEPADDEPADEPADADAPVAEAESADETDSTAPADH